MPITIDLPGPLDESLTERVKASGAASKAEYLLRLVESDCAAAAVESTLTERIEGPFEVLESDWKDRVRMAASKLSQD